MTTAQATAEVFLTALKGLSKKDRSAVIARLAQDKQVGPDLLDLAIVSDRRNEPSRRFDEYLASRKKR